MEYYKLFVRYVSYPLWMLKDGRYDLYRYIHRYRHYNDLSENELLYRQEKGLKKLLQHAGKHSRFYTTLFSKHEVNINCHQSPFEVLRMLPIQTKDIINNNRADIVASNIPSKELFQDSTGGSTGTPLIFYRDKHCILQRRAQEFFFDKWMDCQIGDKIALFVAARHHPRGLKGFKSKIRNATGARMLAFDPNRSDQAYLNEFYLKLSEFKPDIIKSFPNSLYIFARFLKDNGINDIRPRTVSCTGETLHQHQKKLFHEVFQCPIFEKYGSFEIGVAACECSQHNGMHIFTDGAYFEFINQSGEQAKPGELAQLVVTDLFNYGFPLIRYKIGDIGVYTNDKCSCGSQLPLMSRLFGRDRDILVDSQGNLKPGYLFVEVFNKNLIPGKFQVIQESLEMVTVKAIKKNGYTQTHEKIILGNFKKLLGDEVEIRIDYVQDIPREASGKYKWVHSKLNAFNS